MQPHGMHMFDVDTTAGQCFGDGCALRCPDFECILLDPAGLREVSFEGALSGGHYGTVTIE